jgi:hypothetical protein
VTFRRAVALLAVLRILPALVAVAVRRELPGMPAFHYEGPQGDNYGFYFAAREFMAAWGRIPHIAAAAAFAGAAVALWLAVRLWRRGGSDARAAAIGIATTVLALLVTIAVTEMKPSGAGAVGWAIATTVGAALVTVAITKMAPTGAGAIGWPIVWSLVLVPARVAGRLDFHLAFYLGLPIVLAANAATVVATALVGRAVTGRDAGGIVAGALLVVWPFVMRLVEGGGQLRDGAWLNWNGLDLYAEPVSTALVAIATALLVLRRRDPAAVSAAAALLAFATAVRLSNGILLVVGGIAVALLRSRRLLLAYAWPSIAALVIVVAFWSKGYATTFTSETTLPPDLFSWSYMGSTWHDSAIFDEKMLAVLLPFPIVGAVVLRHRPWVLVLLGGIVLTTAAFYSVYYVTPIHPRFLYVALPPLFVLAAAGLIATAEAVARRASPRRSRQLRPG